MILIPGWDPMHPGDTLRESLEHLGMSTRAFAHAIEVPVNRVTSILNGNRSITADSALRFGAFFGTSSDFWIAQQHSFDLRTAEIAIDDGLLERIPPQGTEELRVAAMSALAGSDLPALTERALTIVEKNLHVRQELKDLERLLPVRDE